MNDNLILVFLVCTKTILPIKLELRAKIELFALNYLLMRYKIVSSQEKDFKY